jgi:hypothetical protein
MTSLGSIPGFFIDSPDLVDLETAGESYSCDLTCITRPPVNAAISYAARHPEHMEDTSIWDDSFTLQIDETRVHYDFFVNTLFQKLATCFEAYRGCVVVDQDLDLDDFEVICENAQDTGLDIDGRDTVFRIQPANYFDHLLCERAFDASPDEIQKKLCNSVERVDLENNGVLIIVTSKIVSRTELKPIHDKVARLLNVNLEVPV